MKPIVYRDHLIVPADNRITVLVPHAKPFVDPNSQQALLLVPHRVDETRILRNLGYDVPPPVLLGYDWNGDTPFDSQRVTTAMITNHKRCFVLNSMGTGKTRAALYAYDYLRKSNQSRGRLLVVAPLATLRQTWQREVALKFRHLRVGIMHGTKAQRLKVLADDNDVLVVNHDGVGTIIEELLASVKAGTISMCVLDELSVYKNAATALWKVTNRLVSNIDRVCGMTGTPMPTVATDAYGQIKMIAPQALQGRSFGRFRELVMKKVTQFKWINQPNATDIVYKMMQPAVRFTRDDCYDLPPCQILRWEAPLPESTRRMLLQLKDQGAIESMNIKAANGADVLNKCLQAALGVVYDADRNHVPTDVAARLELLDSALLQSNSKVIVFTPYKHTLDMLRKHIEANYSVGIVSGDVSPRERERIFTMFRSAPDPQVLLAHPECMSHGLTLTEASTIVWWGPPASLETYEQANGRITRAGQKHSQLIIQLTSTNIERRIFKLLEQRADVQSTLLQMFASQDIADLL